MPPKKRKRRYTLLAMAVLDAVASQHDAIWPVQAIADECHIEYGSAYPVVLRLYKEGLLARETHSGVVEGFGFNTHWWYSLSERGAREHKIIREYNSDPIGALKALLIEEPPQD